MEWNEGCITLGNGMCHWEIGLLEPDYHNIVIANTSEWLAQINHNPR